MKGDILARGGHSATFPSLSHVPQDKWDDIFGKRPLNIMKKAKKNEPKKPRGKATQER